jgi:hypothetical protein
MDMKRLAITALLLAAACDSNPISPAFRDRVTAADAFTRHYAESRLRKWDIRAHAAGTDCSVLFVETPMLLDDSVIEALHYGTGAYAVYDGRGVQHFCHQRAFRGAAYRDRSGHVWTFGKVSVNEAETLTRCR